jgi:hypothetical protein
MGGVGRWLIVMGITFLLVGVTLIAADRLGLGRLPGDLVVRRPSFTLHVPIATSLVLSVVLTIVLNLLLRK